MSDLSPGRWSLDLTVLDGPLAVCRLPPDSTVPEWALGHGALASVTRTPEELSLVCPAGAVPPGVRSEGPWRALKVEGPLDFQWVGILASLSSSLAEGGISLFALSTFDTDYLLVREDKLQAARAALAKDGHRVR